MNTVLKGLGLLSDIYIVKCALAFISTKMIDIDTSTLVLSVVSALMMLAMAKSIFFPSRTNRRYSTLEPRTLAIISSKLFAMFSLRST